MKNYENKKKAIKAVRIILCCLKIESGYNFQKQCHGMTSLYRVTHCIDVGNTRDCEWWGFRHGEWTRKVERENSVLLNYTIILEIEKECWSNMLMFKLLQLLIKNKSWKQNFCDFFLLSSRFLKKKKFQLHHWHFHDLAVLYLLKPCSLQQFGLIIIHCDLLTQIYKFVEHKYIWINRVWIRVSINF